MTDCLTNEAGKKIPLNKTCKKLKISCEFLKETQESDGNYSVYQKVSSNIFLTS